MEGTARKIPASAVEAPQAAKGLASGCRARRRTASVGVAREGLRRQIRSGAHAAVTAPGAAERPGAQAAAAGAGDATGARSPRARPALSSRPDTGAGDAGAAAASSAGAADGFGAGARAARPAAGAIRDEEGIGAAASLAGAISRAELPGDRGAGPVSVTGARRARVARTGAAGGVPAASVARAVAAAAQGRAAGAAGPTGGGPAWLAAVARGPSGSPRKPGPGTVGSTGARCPRRAPLIRLRSAIRPGVLPLPGGCRSLSPATRESSANSTQGAAGIEGPQRPRPQAQAGDDARQASRSASVRAMTRVALSRSARLRFSSARWPLASSMVWGPAP